MFRKYRYLWKWFVLLIVVVLVTLIVFNRDWIKDFWRGLSYKPSTEMAQIRDKLDLTSQGEFLFNASQPVLNESEDFNEICRFEKDEENAVLGCYREENIYVYNIEDSELDGIRELTAAHELLHAVWARMGESERMNYADSLSEVLKQNKEILEDELGTYDSNEQKEELYVRAGTEIKKLPNDLEKHFATIFKNQDKVVDYYNKYISVFNNLKAEMEGLMAEMNRLQGVIDEKTVFYEQRANQLNAEIVEFNNCAEMAGCFTSQWAFYQRRNALIAEQAETERLYDEINSLIDEYNINVEKYNQDVISNKKLNQKINSAAKVEDLD